VQRAVLPAVVPESATDFLGLKAPAGAAVSVIFVFLVGNLIAPNFILTKVFCRYEVRLERTPLYWLRYPMRSKLYLED